MKNNTFRRLLAMAAALFGGAVLFLRRRKYESI